MSSPLPRFSDAEILSARPAKKAVDLSRPYAYLVEPERTSAGHVEDVATLFLTNRECPFRCLMCDLWRNTTDASVPRGAIPQQIDFALARLPAAAHIKLYNSGNFFDAKAVPRDDLPAIAERVRGFRTVIVENHPRLCSEACVRFRDQIEATLEVAVGLETIHPDVLPALNKQMTLESFEHATRFLLDNAINVRVFILLRPPFLGEDEGVAWAIRSIEYAFSLGVGVCSVIPTRVGNGIMERLQQQGFFAPPQFRSLERVLETGIAMGHGRVFVDLWEIERQDPCPKCGPARIERLRQMNLMQAILPALECDCGTT